MILIFRKIDCISINFEIYFSATFGLIVLNFFHRLITVDT